MARETSPPHRHAVDVVAEIEREVGEVEHPFMAAKVLECKHRAVPEHRAGDVHRKLVVSGGHRRVRGENASGADGGDVLRRDARPAGGTGLLAQQLHDEQARVPFVHVKAIDLPVAERPQHPHAADAQHDFLAEPIPLVPAVEDVCEPAILGIVFRHVRVEEIHRHLSFGAGDLEPPASDPNRPPLDFDGDARGFFGEKPPDVPRIGLLDLAPGGVEPLTKIALPVEQRYPDDTDAEVGGRPERVTGEHAKTAGISRHLGPETDFHREIGDERHVGHAEARLHAIPTFDLLFPIHQLHDLPELFGEEPDHVVNRDDADERAGVIDHRQAPDAAFLHQLQRLVQTRIFVRDQQVFAHRIADRDEREVAGIRGHDAQDDIAIGEDADRHLCAVAFGDDDDRADVQHPHALGGIDNALAPRRDDDLPVADGSDCHGNPRVLGRSAGLARIETRRA
jgi:hypothetical protein